MVDDKKYNPSLNRDVDEGFTLVEFFGYLKRNILILFGFVFTTLILGIVYTWFLVTPMYNSKATISFNIEQSNSLSQTYSYLRSILPTQEELLKREEFLKMVITKAESENTPIKYNVTQIQKSLTITVNNDKLLVYITVKDANPNQAYIIASTIAKLAVEEIDYSQEGTSIVSTFILHYPRVPQSPASPNKTLNIIISLMVGGILGVIVILLKEQFSNHFVNIEEIEKLTGYPVIGEIYEQVDSEKGD